MGVVEEVVVVVRVVVMAMGTMAAVQVVVYFPRTQRDALYYSIAKTAKR